MIGPLSRLFQKRRAANYNASPRRHAAGVDPVIASSLATLYSDVFAPGDHARNAFYKQNVLGNCMAPHTGKAMAGKYLMTLQTRLVETLVLSGGTMKDRSLASKRLAQVEALAYRMKIQLASRADISREVEEARTSRPQVLQQVHR